MKSKNKQTQIVPNHFYTENLNSMDYCTERSHYVHRCPFSHCPHHDTMSTETDHHHGDIKVSLLDIEKPIEDLRKSIQYHNVGNLDTKTYIARGSQNLTVPNEYRRKAISYM